MHTCPSEHERAQGRKRRATERTRRALGRRCRVTEREAVKEQEAKRDRTADLNVEGSTCTHPSEHERAQGRKRRAPERERVDKTQAPRERTPDLNVDVPACTHPSSKPPSIFSIGTQFIICLLLSSVRKLKAENASLLRENLDLKTKALWQS